MRNSATIIERTPPYVVYNTERGAVDLNDGPGNKEELYRRLSQSWRFLAQPLDSITRDRIAGLVGELEQQIAEVEARTRTPPSSAA